MADSSPDLDSEWLDTMVNKLIAVLQAQLDQVGKAVGPGDARSRPPTRAPWRRWSARWNGCRNWNANAPRCARKRSPDMMHARRWSIDWISALPPSQRASLLASLSDEEAAALQDWQGLAHDAQLPPEGAWRIWLFLGGRGAGKTRAGCEWIAGEVRCGRMARIGLIGATMRDARAVMVEGESGLLNVVEGLDFQPSNNIVRWPGGAVATLLSAEEPDSFRGHQSMDYGAMNLPNGAIRKPRWTWH